MPVKRKRSAAEGHSEIVALGERIASSKKNLNDVQKLFAYLDAEEHEKVAAIHALFGVFDGLITKNAIYQVETLGEDAPENVTARWIRKNFDKLVDKLCEMMQTEASQRVIIAAIKAVMDFFKSLSLANSRRSTGLTVDNELLLKVLKTICSLDQENAAVQAFIKFYFMEYDDMRFYSFRNMTLLFNGLAENKLSFIVNAGTVFGMLSEIEEIPEELGSFFVSSEDIPVKETSNAASSKSHKKAYTEAWISFLKLPLSPSLYRKVLSIVHTHLLPLMSDPRQLHGFLTDSYNQGGTISILALQGLFTLIQNYNLDYPSFYEKLYALFDRNITHSQKFPEFMRLASLFLNSTHIPTYLVAAFIKRMARLCLFSPDRACILMVALIYKLLRDNPSCIVLLHKEIESGRLPEVWNDDPFVFEESNLNKCNAIESSLWEIHALESHICPEIVNLIKKFKQPVTSKNLPSIDFKRTLESYDFDYMEHLLSKEITQAPALNDLKEVKTLFSAVCEIA
jgi:U3 small nucleolar RNA-associated protein 19